MPPSSTATSGPPRRSGIRGQANAEAILAAAHRLVAERGEDFTTQELIREADVALQTFYRHYGSKDQLLLAVIADMIEGHCETLAARAAEMDDPVARLHLYVRETLGTLGTAPATNGSRFMTSQHWRLHQILPDALAAATQPYADLIRGELEAAKADGSLAPRSPERDAWLITQLVMSVFHHYAYVEGEINGDALADDVWQFCLAAVS